MLYFLLAQALSALLDLIWSHHRSDHDKDSEILVLRQQLLILQRNQPRPPRISRWEKLTLLVLVRILTALTNGARLRLSQVVLVFKPETLLTWHRALVRRKWTVRKGAPPGRPPISPALEALLLRLAKENPRWGYGKLEGELLKLGYDIGRSTIRDVLKRRRIPPAPERGRHGSSWRTFLAHYQGHILACDFFTVETAWLKTLVNILNSEFEALQSHKTAFQS